MIVQSTLIFLYAVVWNVLRLIGWFIPPFGRWVDRTF